MYPLKKYRAPWWVADLNCSTPPQPKETEFVISPTQVTEEEGWLCRMYLKRLK
jgi:hypothetical protein